MAVPVKGVPLQGTSLSVVLKMLLAASARYLATSPTPFTTWRPRLAAYLCTKKLSTVHYQLSISIATIEVKSWPQTSRVKCRDYDAFVVMFQTFSACETLQVLQADRGKAAVQQFCLSRKQGRLVPAEH